MSRSLVLVAVFAAMLTITTLAPPTPVAAVGGYVPPVEGVIIDRFRPPTTPYGPGNRGLDYRTTPLSPVRASGDGEVIFAGQVAGGLHVTIRHPDGLRTTYSFLASIGAGVAVGRQVRQGDVIGLTGEVFHFGVRDPAGTYLDPALLFAGRVTVHLVPSGDDGAPPVSTTSEAALLGRAARDRFAFLRPSLERLRVWTFYAHELHVETHVARLAVQVDRWNRERHDCTPAGDPAPAPAGRRIVVEVAGIGSTSAHAAVFGVDTDALGYERDDVVRFSYAGGRAPDNPYTARDSQTDLRVSADRLAALLMQVASQSPGVPIDIVAHSQGGVVARLALERAGADGRVPDEIATLVTIGTPHQGADLATAIAAIGQDRSGAVTLTGVQRALGLELDPSLPAGEQLGRTSSVIDELGERPMPSGVRFTSIGARGDVVVPAGRTAVDVPGSHQIVLPVDGLHAHDELPRRAETTREIALAIAGRSPTCQGLSETVGSAAASELIGWSEDRAGAALAGGFVATPP